MKQCSDYQFTETNLKMSVPRKVCLAADDRLVWECPGSPPQADWHTPAWAGSDSAGLQCTPSHWQSCTLSCNWAGGHWVIQWSPVCYVGRENLLVNQCPAWCCKTSPGQCYKLSCWQSRSSPPWSCYRWRHSRRSIAGAWWPPAWSGTPARARPRSGGRAEWGRAPLWGASSEAGTRWNPGFLTWGAKS